MIKHYIDTLTMKLWHKFPTLSCHISIMISLKGQSVSKFKHLNCEISFNMILCQIQVSEMLGAVNCDIFPETIETMNVQFFTFISKYLYKLFQPTHQNFYIFNLSYWFHSRQLFSILSFSILLIQIIRCLYNTHLSNSLSLLIEYQVHSVRMVAAYLCVWAFSKSILILMSVFGEYPKQPFRPRSPDSASLVQQIMNSEITCLMVFPLR